jgi:hypothetical protein
MSEAPERIWIEDPEEMVPYFYEESELHEVAAPVLEYTRTDLVQAKVEAAVKRALEGAAEKIIAMRGPVDVPRTDKAVVFDGACEMCIGIIRALDSAQFVQGDKT